jgi:GTP diphosphokinase / guanosine-3',5'-bis(diphosphate) 3'-diphosphatase
MLNTSNDTAALIEAIAFAAHKHRDQRRKDVNATPYINHPLSLAHVLAVEAGVTDLPTIIAAILHDTIEDTETTHDELARHFGATVADVVAEVTDDKRLPKEMRKQLQVEHAHDMSFRAKRVKLADKTCNLRDVAVNPPAGWELSRRVEYFDWAKRVVDNLRGVDATLEALFDQAYAAKPEEGSL